MTIGGGPSTLTPEFEGFTSLAAVATPELPRRLARLALAGTVATALVLAFAPWRQTAMGKGRAVAFAPMQRQQRVESPVDARVARWYVQEGSSVKAGAPLVELQDVDPDLMARLDRELAAVRGRIAAAEARRSALTGRAEALAASRARGLQGAAQRVQMAEMRTRAAREALAAAEAARVTAQLNRDRQLALREKGLVSDRAVELAELELTRTVTDRARAAVAVTAAEAEQAALEADRTRVDTDGTAAMEDARGGAAGARVEAEIGRAELARLEVRRARQAAQTVRAPQDGTVYRLTAFETGGLVKTGDPLAMLVPDTKDRAVEVWIDGNDAPLVRADRSVRIQFEGFPAIQFSGWPDWAVGTYGGRVAFVEATDDGHGHFRTVIVPDGKGPWPDPQILRQGMRANAWVLLDVVPLGYELWRQFNGFPLDYVGEEPGKKKGGDYNQQYGEELREVERSAEVDTKLDTPASRLRK